MPNRRKLKYNVNFIYPAIVGEEKGKWKCDKCQQILDSWERVKLHKQQIHSY